MKNFKLFLAFLAVSTVACASQKPAAQVKTETAAPVAKSYFACAKDGFNSAVTATQKAVATTKSYVEVPFVKANEYANTLNKKMFTVAANDTSYSAMLKNNAAQITAATLVTAAVVYGAYNYLNKSADKKAKN
jgi:hypothetical protein